MVQAITFSGKKNEDASAHLHNFLDIYSTVVIKNIFSRGRATSFVSVLIGWKSKAVVLCK
jgi:hypothetical protein